MTPASNDTLQRHFALFCFVLLGIYTLPTPAHAGNVSEVLCTVYSWLAGPLGRVMGALAVVCVAFMAMFGRIQLPTVLITLAGLTLVFGASGVVEALGLDPACGSAKNAKMIMGSKIYTMFSCLHGWIGGPVGKSLATLAIITMGVFAMYGKISYQQALIIASGIAAMFGAYSIIGDLGFDVGDEAKLSAVKVCGTTNPLGTTYCSLVNWFNGPFGKALATIAIIIIGIGALYGKVSWGMAILAGVGVGLVFGGTTIVGALGGPSSIDCAAAGSGEKMYITVALCNVINWFNGPVGKGVTTLAVIILGLGALFGKVSWTMALVGITGVALVFGATSVVSGLGGIGDAPCAIGDMRNPKGGAGGGGGGASSSSTSGSSGGINPVSGYPAGGTIIYTGGTLVFPNGSTPGSITFEGETVQIPADVVAMDTVTLSNGWILRVPGTGIDGSITIPGKPPLVDRVIPIPGYKAPASNGTNPLTPGFPAAPNTPTPASPTIPSGTIPSGPVTSTG